MRNIVFIMDVDLKGTGRWASERTRPYHYSIKSWEQWCKRNDCDLFILNHSLVDHTKMGLCWQRYYLFDILDSN